MCYTKYCIYKDIKYRTLCQTIIFLLGCVGIAIIGWRGYKQLTYVNNLYHLDCTNIEFEIEVNQTCMISNDERCIKVYAQMSYNISINGKTYSGNYLDFISSLKQDEDMNKNIADALVDAQHKRSIGTVLDCGYLDPSNNYQWIRSKPSQWQINVEIIVIIFGCAFLGFLIEKLNCECLDSRVKLCGSKSKSSVNCNSVNCNSVNNNSDGLGNVQVNSNLINV